MYVVYVIVQCMCGVRSEKLASNSETTKQRNNANKLLKNGCFCITCLKRYFIAILPFVTFLSDFYCYIYYS